MVGYISSTLRRQSQVDLCEFKARLNYIMSSRTEKPCLRKQTKNPKINKFLKIGL